MLAILICCFYSSLPAQVVPSPLTKKIDSDTSQKSLYYLYYKNRLDLIDLAYIVLHKNQSKRLDSTGIKNTNFYVTLAPVIEFTTATGFSPGIAGNVAFLTSIKEKTNTSSILGAIKYTQKKQFLFPVQSSIWRPGNRINFLGDWRYFNYPQDAFGFGGHTELSDKYIIDYKYIRFYESVQKKIGNNWYAGIGYQLDYHWQINEQEVQPPGRITDFQKYGFSTISTSSGIAINLLYDSRENSINPSARSFYANAQLVVDRTFLGASSNWSRIVIDVRKYLKMPLKTVLALWCFSMLNISGDPPYLDLPGTGADTYNNTGRGYEQARFIGQNMVDLEAELRFGITKNGLLGAVIFGNAETVSELGTNRFEVISPAFGIGLRIKFNKFSNTNTCIDFGVGTKGSHGFVGNLGEAF